MFKRFFALFSAFAAAFCLIACTSAPPPEEANDSWHDQLNDHAYEKTSVKWDTVNSSVLHDHTLYRFNGKGIEKVDLLTGASLGPACTDPGCPHNAEGCISFSLPLDSEDVGGISVNSGQTILQAANDDFLFFSIGKNLYSYDFAKAKIRLIKAFPGNAAFTAFLYENSMYINCRMPDDEQNTNDSSEYHYALVRLDIGSGNAEEIASFGTRNIVFAGMNDGRLYCTDGFNVCFSTDLNFQDRKELLNVPWLYRVFPAKEGLIYSVISEFTDAHQYKACHICLLDDHGGGECICDESVSLYFVTGKYVYYIPREPEESWKNYRLIRIDHNGGNREEVLTMTNLDRTKMQSVSSFIIDGDYMLAETTALSQNEEGKMIGVKSVFYYDLIEKTYRNIESETWLDLDSD